LQEANHEAMTTFAIGMAEGITLLLRESVSCERRALTGFASIIGELDAAKKARAAQGILAEQ
jgi:hypothetical protein